MINHNLYTFLGGLEMVLDTNNDDYLVTEIDKQKRKLREIGKTLDQQYQLMRLIVQVIN